MTPDELGAIRNVPNIIAKGERAMAMVESWSRFSPEERRANAYPVILRIVTDGLPELRHVRDIVEVHSVSGEPFPPIAIEVAKLLAESPFDWLKYINSDTAEAWRTEARAIVDAVIFTLGSNTNSGQTKVVRAPEYVHLNTEKSISELKLLCKKLAEEGYIDLSHPAAEQSFLNAFDPTATEQGRIVWTAPARNGRKTDKAGICAFLSRTLPHSFDIWEQAALKIFGVEIGRHERDRYYNNYNKKEDILKALIE